MQSRIRIFLLSILFSLSVGLNFAQAEEKPTASDGSEPNPDKEIIQTDPVIQPEVQRREVKESDINTENFELGLFFGFLSIEDFGTDIVYGLRLDYHITEDLFLQGSYGLSSAGTTSFERIGGITLLSDAQRDYTYYNVLLGYNLLPGEAFITRSTTFNSSLYVVAGAGNTEFAGDNHFTITWGAGYAITVNSWLAVHLDFRDHVFNIAVTGEDKTTHNLEATLGINYYF